MLCVQALVQAKESSVLIGVSVGFSLLYSDLRLESDYQVDSPGLTVYRMSRQKPSKCLFELRNEYRSHIKSQKKKRCNIDPAISLGYSFRVDNWHFGAVGEVSFGKTRKSYDLFDDQLSVETKIPGFSSTFKLKGGYYFIDLNTLMYVTVGMKWRNRSISNKFYYSDKTKLSFSGAKSKLTNPLWLVGLGAECPVYKKVSVFTEYEYSWRSSKNKEILNGVKGKYKFQMKHNLKEHSFRLGVNYYM